MSDLIDLRYESRTSNFKNVPVIALPTGRRIVIDFSTLWDSAKYILKEVKK